MLSIYQLYMHQIHHDGYVECELDIDYGGSFTPHTSHCHKKKKGIF